METGFNMNSATQIDNETPFGKFKQFTKQIVSVPKSEIDRREKAYKKARKHKVRRKVL